MRKLLLVVVVWIMLVGLVAGPSLDVRAQGDPDAWTEYVMNMRAGPGDEHPVVAELAPQTALIIEAHDGEQVWLLAHSADGSARGWVASGYLSYREGFAAFRLPVSSEIVTVQPTPVEQPADAADTAADTDTDANTDAALEVQSGVLESMTLIYSTDHSEYYRIVYMSDGLRVTGFLGWPTSDGPHPVIIYNRGGSWDTGALTGSEIVPLVECGYVAIASNYRGNGGSEGWEQFGAGDVQDVLNLIPVLQSLPRADHWRIGMMGGSRGGMVTFMALKADTQRGQQNFRAAVVVGALSDLFMWAEQRPDIVDVLYMPLIGTRPSVNAAPFIERSAAYWPDLINVPVLLMHGEADAEISVEQSRRMTQVLRDAGRDATLVTYPGDDHPLTGQLGGYPEALRYLDRYLGGDGVNRQFDSHLGDIGPVLEWFFINKP